MTTYGHLKEVNVKADERILKGKMLGTYENHITIDFLKDNKEISYEKDVYKRQPLANNAFSNS